MSSMLQIIQHELINFQQSLFNLFVYNNIMGTRALREQVKVDHFLFGKVTVKNQFNKELITCHKPMLRTDQFNDWQEKYNIAVTMNKQSLLLPQSYQKQKMQKFFMCCQCPADTQMALTYERFDYTLQKQILLRAQSKKYYQQPELFFILYKLLEGAKQFQLRKLRLGDIRACKIVKTKNQDLKMISVASYPQSYSGIDMIMDYLDNKNVYYLAPQQIQFVKSRGYGSEKVPNSKTEAFSLGMTILQCATLVLSKDLYTMPSRQLSVQQLQFRLKNVEERYAKLYQYLIKILQTDKQKRLTSGQLWACLKPYSQKILDVKSFSPKQSSQKEELQIFRNKLGKRSYN